MDFDFIDFGCGRGGSMKWASQTFYGHGIGIDKNESRVEEARRNGHHAFAGDILELPDRKLVDFVVMSHFLEHLPDKSTAQKMIVKAVTVARKFIVIMQPFFDADDYLAGMNLKFFWSDWSVHRYRMPSRDLIRIFSKLKSRSMISDFSVGFRIPVETSAHPAIHSIDSPRNQHEFDPDIHPPKPFDVGFKKVFRETVAYALIKSDSTLFSVLKNLF